MFWSATLGAKTGGIITADVERQIFLSFPPVSLVWAPSTRRLSQYPCPIFDLAALVYNIYDAYILKQRSIGATLEMHLFPAKFPAKLWSGTDHPWQRNPELKICLFFLRVSGLWNTARLSGFRCQRHSKSSRFKGSTQSWHPCVTLPYSLYIWAYGFICGWPRQSAAGHPAF